MGLHTVNYRMKPGIVAVYILDVFVVFRAVAIPKQQNLNADHTGYNKYSMYIAGISFYTRKCLGRADSDRRETCAQRMTIR